MIFDKLIFYHIPRTGGQSLLKTLQPLYNHVTITNIDITSSHPIYNFYIKNKDKKVEFLYIHDWSPNDPLQHIGKLKDTEFMFTIIRNPIHQLHSMYHYLKKDININAMLNEIPQHYDIYQRMIIESENVNQFIDWILDFGHLFIKYILPKGLFSENILKKMNFVGIHEEMENTISHIAKICKNPNIKNMIHINNCEYNKNYNYRYDELKIFFKEEFEAYEYYYNKFKSTIACN